MYIQLIENRRSVRSFKNTPITENHLATINQFLDELNQSVGPFGHSAEFTMIPVSNHINAEGEKIGTYGVIRNPAAYIVGMTKNTKVHLIDFGYTFEIFMLNLLDLGVGSCWLGGTFDRKMLSAKFEKNNSFIIPAITPIGYHDERPSIIEKTMRRFANSDHKLAFETLFFNQNFDNPLKKEAAGIYEIPLEMIRIGPSASNKQPWRMVVTADGFIHFFIKHTPNYNGRLKFDMQLLDIGIGMAHFKSAVDEIGIKGEWRIYEGLQIPINDPNIEYIMSWQTL
ncbi:nitroreductase family protein [Fusibacter sp. 3D3]|uniref:nitroreductase family protein n=1 Tax=Fusibacter sp. 3D3 TaxID=1048380 RepID=UPI0008535B27|nr:nitroreductase family protein [Fusibacter sp. 3D3]GAU77561.1 nitroreductase family protein [Fusibacter sp. 3D3]